MTTHSKAVGRWERLGAAAGVLAALLLMANLIAVSASPRVDDPAREVVDYLRSNDTLTLVYSYLGALTAVLLTLFIASTRSLVNDYPSGAEWRWNVTVVSGGLAAGALLVASGVAAAGVVVADESAPAAHALFVARKMLLTFGLIPIGTLTIVNGPILSTRIASNGPMYLGPFLGGLAILSGTVVFIDSDWFGPGEPVVAGVTVMLGLWLIATAVMMLSGRVGPGRATPENPHRL